MPNKHSKQPIKMEVKVRVQIKESNMVLMVNQLISQRDLQRNLNQKILKILQASNIYQKRYRNYQRTWLIQKIKNAI